MSLTSDPYLDHFRDSKISIDQSWQFATLNGETDEKLPKSSSLHETPAQDFTPEKNMDNNDVGTDVDYLLDEMGVSLSNNFPNTTCENITSSTNSSNIITTSAASYPVTLDEELKQSPSSRSMKATNSMTTFDINLLDDIMNAHLSPLVSDEISENPHSSLNDASVDLNFGTVDQPQAFSTIPYTIDANKTKETVLSELSVTENYAKLALIPLPHQLTLIHY